MALEGITVSVSDLLWGIVLLIVGCVLYAFHTRFPPVADVIAMVAGIILAIIGIVVIILAFV